MKRKYTLLPDIQDARDWLFRETIKAEVKWTWKLWKWLDFFNFKSTSLKDVDLRPSMPPVYDQGQLASCTDNAMCAALSYLEGKESNGLENFSRLFAYWNARSAADKSVDSGSSIRDGIKGVASKGICTEDLWPYDETKFAVCPPTAAWGNAEPRSKGIQYSRLLSLEDMQDCLMSGFPFIFGMAIFAPFESLSGPDCTLPMPLQTDQYMGQHAQCAVGMSIERQAFLVRNSWGTAWGDGGYYWLPWDYVDSVLASDFWTVKKISK